MPKLLSKKQCINVWYSIKRFSLDPHNSSIVGNIQELCNSASQTKILFNESQLGSCFTLAHFAIFFYRVAILTFDQNMIKQEPEKVTSYNLIKKLFHFLRSIQHSNALQGFSKRKGRTFTKSVCFYPSKDLLAQILICEKLDRYMSGQTIDSLSKEEMVNRILDGHNYVELEHQTPRLKTVDQMQ